MVGSALRGQPVQNPVDNDVAITATEGRWNSASLVHTNIERSKVHPSEGVVSINAPPAGDQRWGARATLA